jgi:mRNA-degrading endonuclease toxin of MazEF toxin-antitoxin module
VSDIALKQGSIIRARVTPPRGSEKVRPVLIISPDEVIQQCPEIIGLAISGSFREPLTSEQFMLPWSRHQRAGTGLCKPSVVNCDWPVKVLRSNVIEVMGELSLADLVSIIDAYEAWRRRQQNDS